MGQKKRQQQQQKRLLLGLAALGVFAISTVLAIVGLGNSVSEIRTAEVAQSPDVILASAGAKENHTIALPVIYYDQISDPCVDLYDSSQRAALKERQFEWTNCGYYSKKLESGLASSQLDENGLPVATPGQLTPNRGLDFTKWFTATEGQNVETTGTLQLVYTADGAKFSFSAEDFYPLDDVEFSASDPVNSDGHNHLFTMRFAVPFTVLASGDEIFAITADDDTFVYLDDTLVLDLGGLHRATTAALAIDTSGAVFASIDGEDWQATDVAVTPGEVANLQIFHADRDSSESTLGLEFSGMNLALADGTQIAANLDDPSNPTYVAPLGESKVFQPDSTRSLVVIATVEGLMVIVAAVLVVAVARFVLQQRQQ